MSEDEKADPFADWIAACDDALARGFEPPPYPAGTPTEPNPRARRGLAGMRLLRQALGAGQPGASAPGLPAEGPPRRLGRFDLVRELGRGGFGIVYLAHDPTLERLVALKVPRPEFLMHAGLRQRFLHEARAAAGLDHPNLVPVYEVGEAGPVCYLAAAYCPGTSLAAWLRERADPVPPREAAALLATLAEAVHHAHRHGVVHRDLKPANVLLAFSGVVDESVRPQAAFVPKITDFGIAKVQGAGTTDTTTGVVLGTPSYMAPEQALGSSANVGPAADVYALGVILYEMLTGRPPFRGTTPVETLDLVRSQEPVPPRQLQPQLPLDLDTVCLKCLEKDASRRYGSAEALADDLRRFLEDRPIVARPVGRGERLWRWCRREAAVAGLLAAVLVVLAAGATVSGALAVRANAKAKEAEESAAIARQEAERADRKAEEAEKAESETLASYRASTDDVIEQLIGSKPDLGPQERAYLEKTLTRWQEFARRHGDDERSQAIRAEGHFRVGLLWQKLGKRDVALKEYEQATVLYKKLAKALPAVPDYQRGLATTHNNLGNLLRDLGKRDEARQEYERAREIQRKLLGASPGVPEYRLELARTHNNLGLLLKDLGELDEAREENEQSLELRKQLAKASPAVPEYQRELARSHTNLAILLADLGKREEARKEYETARDLLVVLADVCPGAPIYQLDQAKTRYNQNSLQPGESAVRAGQARRGAEGVRAGPRPPDEAGRLSRLAGVPAGPGPLPIQLGESAGLAGQARGGSRGVRAGPRPPVEAGRYLPHHPGGPAGTGARPQQPGESADRPGQAQRGAWGAREGPRPAEEARRHLPGRPPIPDRTRW